MLFLLFKRYDLIAIFRTRAMVNDTVQRLMTEGADYSDFVVKVMEIAKVYPNGVLNE